MTISKWRVIQTMIGVSCLILGFQNCDSLKGHSPVGQGILHGTASGNPPQDLAPRMMNFKTVSSLVFAPSCVQCHSNSRADGGVNYDNYIETVRSGKLNELFKDYSAHIEPAKECSKISAPLMDLVVDWIQTGAPE